MEETADNIRSLADDLLWPFRDYSRVQDFLSQTEAASLLIGGLGFFIAWLGFAGTIPSAVGALGLASSINEILLRVWYNRTDVWDNLTRRRRGVAFLLNLVVGLGIYFYLVPSAIYTPGTTLLQFFAGLVITYIAGAVYMRTYTHIVQSNAHEATKIAIPGIATIGVVLWLLMAVPAILEMFAGETGETIVQMLENEPENLTEEQ